MGDPSDPSKPGLMIRMDRVEQAALAVAASHEKRRGTMLALWSGLAVTALAEAWSWITRKP